MSVLIMIKITILISAILFISCLDEGFYEAIGVGLLCWGCGGIIIIGFELIVMIITFIRAVTNT